MATSSKKPSSIVCPSCGVTNSPVPPSGRCLSCGASMDSLRASADENGRRGNDGFSVVWAGIALLVQGVLTAAIVLGLPMVVSSLDFEGRHGMMLAVPVWFVGGILLGMISPGKTVAEPVISTLLVAMPTVYFLHKSETVRTLPLFMYVILAGVGLMFTLVGSYLGERIQMGPAPKRATE